MQHHFSIEIAQTYGVNEAIFLENMAFWILHNKANEKNFFEGRYWTYNTHNAFLCIFPYWSKKTLRTTIENCLKAQLIIKGNFNKAAYDKTLWYAFTENGLKLFPFLSTVDPKRHIDMPKTAHEVECGLQGNNSPQSRISIDMPKTAHRSAGIGTPIPDINTDIKHKDLFPLQNTKPVDNSKREERKKESFLDEIFFYNDTHQEICSKFNLDIDYQLEKFKDHALENQRKCKDWDAAFRNWLRKASELNIQKRISYKSDVTKPNEVKSTVKFWGPGHLDWERLNANEINNKQQKDISHGSERFETSFSESRISGLRKAETYFSSIGKVDNASVQ